MKKIFKFFTMVFLCFLYLTSCSNDMELSVQSFKLIETNLDSTMENYEYVLKEKQEVIPLEIKVNNSEQLDIKEIHLYISYLDEIIKITIDDDVYNCVEKIKKIDGEWVTIVTLEIPINSCQEARQEIRLEKVVFSRYMYFSLSAKIQEEVDEVIVFHKHEYNLMDLSLKYLIREATHHIPETYAYSCVCGKWGTNSFVVGDPIPHVFDQKIMNQVYLQTKGDCLTPSVYYYSCVCGEKGSETFAEDFGDDKQNHDYCDFVYDKNGTATYGGTISKTCKKCDDKVVVEVGNDKGIPEPIYVDLSDTTCALIGISGDPSNLTSFAIPEYYNGKQVASISSSIFEKCTKMENITIPFSEIQIGNYTKTVILLMIFGNEIPATLKEVTILGGTDIDDSTFQSCENVEKINLPETITFISGKYFEDCLNLKEITIDEDNPIYDSRDNCNGIIETATNALVVGATNTIIPNSVVSVNSYAFINRKGLTEIIVPDNVTYIGHSAYYGCSNVVSVTIPFIGEYADGSGKNRFTHIFTSSTNTLGYEPITLRHLIVTKQKYYYDYSLSICRYLTSITIPKDFEYFESCFFDWDSLENIYYNGTLEDWSKLQFEDYNNIPINCPINRAAHFYFKDNNGEYYENLEIVIPDNITSLDEVILGGKVKKITIPDTVISMSKRTFALCKELETLIIGDGITTLERDIFENSKNLSNITFGSSIKNMEYNAFSCGELENVYYNGTIEDWCNIVFTNEFSTPAGPSGNFYILDNNNEYSLVTEIEVPNTINKLGSYQFYGFSQVTSIILPDTIVTIPRGCFKYCHNMKSINIPKSVTSIEAYAFEGSGLESVIIPDNVETLGEYAFAQCFSLSNIKLSSNIKKISAHCFYNLVSLKDIVIPSGVEEIESFAFSSCYDLESITIPKTMTIIDADAFSGCKALRNVYYEGTQEEWLNIYISVGNDYLNVALRTYEYVN